MKTRLAAAGLVLAVLVVAALLWLHPWSRGGGAGERTEAGVSGARPEAGLPAGRGMGRAPGVAGTRTDAAPGSGDAAAAGRTVLRGKWGAGRGEFGRKAADESAPEAPMSFVATRGGGFLVLDQVNGRVQRFNADGTPAGEVNVGGDTAQDVAVDASGNLLVLDRLAEAEVSVYGPDGQPRESIPVVGGPITEGGGVTGMFTDPTGTYLEREHTETARVAGPDGVADTQRPAEPGRPSRDGAYYLRAAIADRRAGVVTVRVFDREARLLWGHPVAFPRFIVHLLLLDSDLRGYLYVGGLVADERGEGLSNLATLVLRLRLADGALAGFLTLPPNTSADEISGSWWSVTTAPSTRCCRATTAWRSRATTSHGSEAPCPQRRDWSTTTAASARVPRATSRRRTPRNPT